MAKRGAGCSSTARTREAEVEPHIDLSNLIGFFLHKKPSGGVCENSLDALGGDLSKSRRYHEKLPTLFGVHAPPGYKGTVVRMEETIRQIENNISNGYQSESDESFSLDDLEDDRKIYKYLSDEYGAMAFKNKTQKSGIQIKDIVDNYEDKIQTRSGKKTEDLIVRSHSPKRKRRRSSVDKTALNCTKKISEDPFYQSPKRKKIRSSVGKTVLHSAKKKSEGTSYQSPKGKRTRSSVDQAAFHGTKKKIEGTSYQSPKENKPRSSADQAAFHGTKKKIEGTSYQSPKENKPRSSADQTVLHRIKQKSEDPSYQSPKRKKTRSSADQTVVHDTKKNSEHTSYQSSERKKSRTSADKTVLNRRDAPAVDDTSASVNDSTDLQPKQKVFRSFGCSEWAENKDRRTPGERSTGLFHAAPWEADCLYIQQPIRLSDLSAQTARPRNIYRPSFALDNIVFG